MGLAIAENALEGAPVLVFAAAGARPIRHRVLITK